MDNVRTYILALPVLTAVFFSFFSFVFASGSQSITINTCGMQHACQNPLGQYIGHLRCFQSLPSTIYGSTVCHNIAACIEL